jgi:hypothetical protein
MSTTNSLALLRSRRGVALPLALLGLITVSILVTAALVTSSTDTSIANARQDAAAQLYKVEGGLQAYVSTMGSTLDTATNRTFLSPQGDSLRIDVARLFRSPTPPATPGPADGVALYSITAEPARGGRALVAMVRVPLTFVRLQINAGASLGSDATIGGSIDINATSNLCASDTADDAVVHAAGTSLRITGQAADNIGNDTATFEGGQTDMARHILNGIDLLALGRSADIKFGYQFDKPLFTNTTISMSATNTSYQWGCPAGLVTTCAPADTTYYPVIAIDAATNESGARGTVRIQGDYGQGILVVLNGDLRIEGGFQFKGIILVEGNTDIHGGSGGSGGAKIEGALIGLGDLAICTQMSDSGDCTSTMGDEGSSDLSSGAVIQYNACAIADAQAYANRRAVPSNPTRPTVGWFELLR